MSIVGAGSDTTHIFPRDLDQAFDIARGIKVSLSGLSIENTRPPVQPNQPPFGGGISSGRFGSGDIAQTSLTLSDVTMDNSRAQYAGAIDAHGVLIADRVVLRNSHQYGLVALTFNGPLLRITRSLFSAIRTRCE